MAILKIQPVEFFSVLLHMKFFFYNNCRAAHNLQGLLGYLLCSVQFISMTLDFLTLVFSD